MSLSAYMHNCIYRQFIALLFIYQLGVFICICILKVGRFSFSFCFHLTVYKQVYNYLNLFFFFIQFKQVCMYTTYIRRFLFFLSAYNFRNGLHLPFLLTFFLGMNAIRVAGFLLYFVFFLNMQQTLLQITIVCRFCYIQIKCNHVIYCFCCVQSSRILYILGVSTVMCNGYMSPSFYHSYNNNDVFERFTNFYLGSRDIVTEKKFIRSKRHSNTYIPFVCMYL